jgi:hypothetical protein
MARTLRQTTRHDPDEAPSAVHGHEVFQVVVHA